MRSVLSITVAAIIILHSVLGCCWHHAHESKACSAVESKVDVAAGACGCRHHGHTAPRPASAPDKGESEHPDHRPCDEKCDFVGTGRFEQADSTGVRLVESLTTIDEPVIVPATLGMQVERIADPVSPPPVRRHLLLRLLLI